eukprot:COSAG02_NODE_52001_length_310_cov_1.227488_2_plen_33_part_01
MYDCMIVTTIKGPNLALHRGFLAYGARQRHPGH